MAILNEDEIEKRFDFHPLNGDQLGRYGLIREKAKELAMVIYHNTPFSREQSLALTHLEEVVFFANAGITRRKEEE